MSRRSRMPRPEKVRSEEGSDASSGWGALTPIVALCAIALVISVLAFGGRGGAETRSGAACLTDSVPGRFGSWDDFFRRYPFDDAFLRSRIRAANGAAPDGVVVVPLEAGASCGKPD
ncbi:hypothetical protein BH10PSE1_BH10PSE1_19180 [soil metagenome]